MKTQFFSVLGQNSPFSGITNNYAPSQSTACLFEESYEEFHSEHFQKKLNSYSKGSDVRQVLDRTFIVYFLVNQQLGQGSKKLPLYNKFPFTQPLYNPGRFIYGKDI